jgi:uncharacterized RDD family membrane protein YckC
MRPVNAYQIPADPTAVVGRRIGAYVINSVILGAALFLGTSLADFKSEDIPAGFEDSLGGRSVCDVIQEDSSISQCFELNDTVYYSDSSAAAVTFWAPWLIVAVVNHVVIAGVAGGSIGKLAVGLRVVKKDTGQIAGIGPAIIRSLLWIVDAAPWCFPLVGLVTMLTTKGHRRVGDMAAGTLVVMKDAVGRPPVVPGLTSPAMAAMAAPGGYAPPSGGPGWAPPAPTWGTPPPPTQDPWSAPPPPTAAPDPWAPPTPSYSPPAYEPPVPVPAVEPPTPSWEPPAPTDEPATSAYPAAPAWESPAPAWEPPAPAESTVLSEPEPAPEPAPAPTWEPAPARSPAWEPQTVLAPEPSSEPEPEPEPVAEAAPAATETPGVGAPMWDAARNAYIQWDPSVGSWMQWDDAAGQWRPIS